MAKLKGAAKRKFLARMAAGRRKAASRKSPKRKTRTSKRSPSRKANKPKRRSPSVAKKRSSSKQSFSSKIPLINNPTFKKAATGIGVATLGATILGLVVPQLANQPLVKPILALAGGGVPGVVAQFLVQGGGNLGSLFGGGNGGNGGGNNPAFA